MRSTIKPEGTMRVVILRLRAYRYAYIRYVSAHPRGRHASERDEHMTRSLMTAKDAIELEELKKDTATTRSVLCSAQKVLAADEVGDEQLMTALRVKFSSMIQSVQHLLCSCYQEGKTVGHVPCFLH